MMYDNRNLLHHYITLRKTNKKSQSKGLFRPFFAAFVKDTLLHFRTISNTILEAV